MLIASKIYKYEKGTLIFKFRDNKTDVFVKRGEKVSFVESSALTVEALDHIGTLADLYAKEYALDELIRSFIHVDYNSVNFEFSESSQKDLCQVDISYSPKVIKTRYVTCDLADINSIYSVIHYFMSVEGVRFKRY